MQQGMSKEEFNSHLRSLEKAMHRSLTLMKSNSELENLLKSFFLEMEAVENAVKNNSELNNHLKKQLKEKNFLHYFSEFEKSLEKHCSLHSELAGKKASAGNFLDFYKDSKNYNFGSEKKSIDFLERVFSIYNSGELYYKPRYLGVINVDKLSTELSLPRARNEMLKIPNEKINVFLNSLIQRKIADSFSLLTPALKIHFQDIKNWGIEANLNIQKRIDREYKELAIQ